MQAWFRFLRSAYWQIGHFCIVPPVTLIAFWLWCRCQIHFVQTPDHNSFAKRRLVYPSSPLCWLCSCTSRSTKSWDADKSFPSTFSGRRSPRPFRLALRNASKHWNERLPTTWGILISKIVQASWSIPSGHRLIRLDLDPHPLDLQPLQILRLQVHLSIS